MKVKWELLVIFLLFFASLGTRLYFAYKTPFFSDDNSYFVLRQAEHIKNTGRLITEGELSYGGRIFALMPFFYYLIAGLSIFFNPINVGKIISNVLISTIIFAAYLVALEITKNKWSAIISAILAATTPILVFETINSISIYSITLPLTFFSIYFLIKIDKEKEHINSLVLILFILILSDPMSAILIIGLLIYMILCYIEKIKKSKAEIEAILFAVFLFLWANFIIYKKAFQLHGIQIIWNNAPSEIINRFFTRISLAESAYLIGIVPIIIGIIVIYNYLFRSKSPSLYLIISVCISSFFMSWFRLINVMSATIFLSTCLAILAGQFTKDLLIYVRKTKFAYLEKQFLAGFVIFLSFSSILPAVAYAKSSVNSAPNEEDISAFAWLKNNTPTESIVLATIDEGNLITYFGNRKNVIDSNFILIPNIDQRVKDLRTIYTSRYLINAVSLLDKYKVSYIMVTGNVKREYNITNLAYAGDGCLELVFNSTTEIYEKKCSLENEN
ncbi:MAG: glycosyltransferase family 39 protein [archaeon]